MPFAVIVQAKGKEKSSVSVHLYVFPAFVKQFATWSCQKQTGKPVQSVKSGDVALDANAVTAQALLRAVVGTPHPKAPTQADAIISPIIIMRARGMLSCFCPM